MIRIKDIADRAGVSPTTVSNVIHGKTGRVSKATVEKNQPDFKGDGVRAEYQRAHAGEQQLRSYWCGAWFHEERKCIFL